MDSHCKLKCIQNVWTFHQSIIMVTRLEVDARCELTGYLIICVYVQSLTMVTMATEENNPHLLNDVVQQSAEEKDVQARYTTN